jgi:hypothetical protein
MFADTKEELLSLAKKIGLSPNWLQNKRGFLHFDLTINMRVKAIRAGAISVDRNFIADYLEAHENRS